MPTCYRHPNRETGVSCSSCGRPICPDCMTPTPVGMRCPECARQRTKTHTRATIQHAGWAVTRVLIAINVVVWLAEIATSGGGHFGGGAVLSDGALYGPAVHGGHDYWRLVTSGFLHDNRLPGGILHIGFNMYLLYVLGRMLEPAIGRSRFLVVYLVSLLAGSFGALLVSWGSVTVGASGAVFGLMGASVVIMRHRGVDPMASGIPGLILINLIFSFTLSGISIGGHIGGLIGGVLCALLLTEIGERGRAGYAGMAACVALGAVAAVAATMLTGSTFGG